MENHPIEELDLPPRVYRCLKNAGLHTTEQILQTPPAEFLRIRNFGQRSLRLLHAALRKKGLRVEPAGQNLDRKRDLTVLLGMPIEQIGFTEDLVNRLHLAQIEKVGELVTLTRQRLQKFPSLGPRSIQLVRRILNDMGLDLGMDYVPVDESAETWMDRLDAARLRLQIDLMSDAAKYFFCKEYHISPKILARFLANRPLSLYESNRLRSLFSKTIDLKKQFDFTRCDAYRSVRRIINAYHAAGSLMRAAAELGVSHEQVRRSLKLQDDLKLPLNLP